MSIISGRIERKKEEKSRLNYSKFVFTAIAYLFIYFKENWKRQNTLHRGLLLTQANLREF